MGWSNDIEISAYIPQFVVYRHEYSAILNCTTLQILEFIQLWFRKRDIPYAVENME